MRQQEGADRDGDSQSDAEFGDDSISVEDERSEDADHDQGGGGDDSPGFGLAQTDGPRNVQGALRVRQGDVHDGGVEHDQQGRRDDHRPAPATARIDRSHADLRGGRPLWGFSRGGDVTDLLTVDVDVDSGGLRGRLCRSRRTAMTVSMTVADCPSGPVA